MPELTRHQKKDDIEENEIIEVEIEEVDIEEDGLKEMLLKKYMRYVFSTCSTHTVHAVRM